MRTVFALLAAADYDPERSPPSMPGWNRGADTAPYTHPVVLTSAALYILAAAGGIIVCLILVYLAIRLYLALLRYLERGARGRSPHHRRY